MLRRKELQSSVLIRMYLKECAPKTTKCAKNRVVNRHGTNILFDKCHSTSVVLDRPLMTYRWRLLFEKSLCPKASAFYSLSWNLPSLVLESAIKAISTFMNM